MLKYDEENASLTRQVDLPADEESSYIGSVDGAAAVSDASTNPIENRSPVVAAGVPASSPDGAVVATTAARASIVPKSTRKKRFFAIAGILLLLAVVVAVVVSTNGRAAQKEDANQASNVAAISDQPTDGIVTTFAELDAVEKRRSRSCLLREKFPSQQRVSMSSPPTLPRRLLLSSTRTKRPRTRLKSLPLT